MAWFRGRDREELEDAREEALRWYERLGGQIMNLPPGNDPATRQALVDAGERYHAAGAQLDRATSVKQFALAQETAIEGLSYIRAARTAMGLDPGPALPPLAGQQRAGAIRADRAVDVQGRQYRASPQPGGGTPYYYPGGLVGGRPVPSGWYSEPWWKTALVAGAAGIGGALLFDAFLEPGFGFGGGFGGFGGGYGQEMAYERGFDQGFEQGEEAAEQQDDDGGDDGGYDDGGGDFDGGFDDGGGGDF